MSKVKTQASLPPLVFSPGLGIYEDHVQAVAENLNYVAGESPTMYFCFATAGENWGSGNNPGPHNVIVPGTSGANKFYDGQIWIDEEEQVLELGSIMNVGVGQEVQVLWTIGAATSSVTHTDADNGNELTTTVTVAVAGTGWQIFKVELDHTVGSGTNSELHSLRCEAMPVAAADLPDPGNE